MYSIVFGVITKKHLSSCVDERCYVACVASRLCPNMEINAFLFLWVKHLL